MSGAQAIEEAAFKVYLRSQRRCALDAATIIVVKLQACVFLSFELHLLTRFIARFIPIFPALPNGLKDAIAASQSSTALPPDSRQRGMVSHHPFSSNIQLKKVI